jgi:hypothetical protein
MGALVYEAVVLALTEFRRCGLADATFGPATRLTIRVKQPETEHSAIKSTGRLVLAKLLGYAYTQIHFKGEDNDYFAGSNVHRLGFSFGLCVRRYGSH